VSAHPRSVRAYLPAPGSHPVPGAADAVPGHAHHVRPRSYPVPESADRMPGRGHAMSDGADAVPSGRHLLLAPDYPVPGHGNHVLQSRAYHLSAGCNQVPGRDHHLPDRANHLPAAYHGLSARPRLPALINRSYGLIRWQTFPVRVHWFQRGRGIVLSGRIRLGDESRGPGRAPSSMEPRERDAEGTEGETG
jgi:hypothetical protein